METIKAKRNNKSGKMDCTNHATRLDNFGQKILPQFLNPKVSVANKETMTFSGNRFALSV